MHIKTLTKDNLKLLMHFIAILVHVLIYAHLYWTSDTVCDHGQVEILHISRWIPIFYRGMQNHNKP